MRSLDAALIAGLALLAAAAADAGPPIALALPAGPLGAAVASLGQQAGISIGVVDQEIARHRVGALAGRMPAEAAIARLARDAGACVDRIDADTFRIDRCPAAAPPPPPRPASPDHAAGHAAAGDPAAPIVVTASKRGTAEADYAGTAIILSGDVPATAAGLQGTAAIVSRLPSLASTNLGSGRNKLFIRGVADSSFNGPTQATVGQYFGDVRLNYNAPDPDLVLYDITRVEVLEGPQGTLYGAGSLGGIYRIVPQPVDLAAVHGSLTAGRSATTHGAPGGDVAAMLNLPVVAGRLGLRGVAYRSVDGGYIDDVQRGLEDVNRTRTVGGRLALAGQLGGWTVTAAGVIQNIDSADGQYTEAGLAPLQRRSALPQPFDNDYALASVGASRDWGSLKLVSVASATRHLVTASYDFTAAGAAPTLYTQRNEIALYSGEARLSRTGRDGGGWLIGGSLVFDDEALIRALGPPDALQRTAGVRNTILDGALFGETTVALSAALLLTAGGRLSVTALSGEALDQQPGATGSEPNRQQLRFLPSLGLAWHPGGGPATLFARVQQGFRPGGLEVSGDPAAPDVQHFQGDLITTWEIGARAGADRVHRLSLAATLSYAAWNNMQADLVTAAGQPFTTNIGQGRILGAELRLGWRPAANLALEATGFLNESELVHPAPAFVGSDASQLPNIPGLGARAALRLSQPLAAGWAITSELAARYVGSSRLGVGPVLNIPQGDYLDASADLRIGTERLGLSLGVANLTDTAANTFSLGDPFRVADRLQRTPVRPRTFRLGVDARF